jgi:hypothetical protein
MKTKTRKLNGLTKNIMSGLLVTLILFSFNSCAVKSAFLSSSVVPAAKGNVKVKRDKNKNYVIQVNVTNLAEVARLQPPKQTYVVWMVSDQEETNNIGQLKSSKNFLSKQMSVSFETVSSSKPVKIFITAENDGGTQYPGEQIVLTTNNFQSE